MAITSVGYAGTVSDAQWAQMAQFAAGDKLVRDASSFAITQSSGTRTFDVAPGVAMGSGIMDTSNAPVNIAPTVPSAGNSQWHAIVLHRNWATKATDITFRAGPTAANITVPTAGPSAEFFAGGSWSGVKATPGTEDDQLIGFVWINGTNTTTFVADARRASPIIVQTLAGLTSLVGLPYQTARVMNDPNPANNGEYRFVGAVWLMLPLSKKFRFAGITRNPIPNTETTLFTTTITLPWDATIYADLIGQIQMNSVFTNHTYLKVDGTAIVDAQSVHNVSSSQIKTGFMSSNGASGTSATKGNHTISVTVLGSTTNTAVLMDTIVNILAVPAGSPAIS